MKKIFMLCALFGINVLAYGQDVELNINNQGATVIDNCPYRINGICASEDIGGVDTEFIEDDEFGGCTSLVLTNYNSFPVSVVWKVQFTQYTNNIQERSGNTVLGVDGQKKIKLHCGSRAYWSLEGLIVRKLAQ